jgi:hypothetical protein
MGVKGTFDRPAAFTTYSTPSAPVYVRAWAMDMVKAPKSSEYWGCLDRKWVGYRGRVCMGVKEEREGGGDDSWATRCSSGES